MTEPDWEKYRAGVPGPPGILGVSWTRIALAMVLTLRLVAALVAGQAFGPKLWHEVRPWSEADRKAGAHCVDPLLGTAPDIAEKLYDDAKTHGASRVTGVTTSVGPRDAAGKHLTIVEYLLLYRGDDPIAMRAYGMMANEDCSVESLKIEPDHY